MSFIIESLLNLFSCYHLILFLSIFLSVFLLLMTLAALNWCTNSTLSLFDFTQDAVAEHKQEMQKKKDEIERLKKGITVPDVESKVSVVWLEFWDMICARKDDIFGELFSAFLKTWTLHVQWLKMLKSRLKKNIYLKKNNFRDQRMQIQWIACWGNYATKTKTCWNRQKNTTTK